MDLACHAWWRNFTLYHIFKSDLHFGELLLFVKEINMHVTMLNQCSMACCYVQWRRNTLIMCGVSCVFLKVCLSTLLHPIHLYFCAILYSSPKQCDIFFFVLWVIYSNKVIYEFINQELYMYMYFDCMIDCWFAVVCSSEFAFIFEIFCSTEWDIRFID